MARGRSGWLIVVDPLGPGRAAARPRLARPVGLEAVGLSPAGNPYENRLPRQLSAQQQRVGDRHGALVLKPKKLLC